MNSPPRALFVVNVDYYFFSHRLALAEALLKKGFDVTVACAKTDRGSDFAEHGIEFVKVPFSRNFGNPISEIRTMLALARLFRRLKPDLAHLVALKAVGYGSLASRLSPETAVVNAIAGLGFAFTVPGRHTLLQRAIGMLIRLAAGRQRSLTILQNPDDLEELSRRQVIDGKKSVVIRGSGVDTKLYHQRPLPSGKRTVMFAARLNRDKGVEDFVEACEMLAAEGFEARFVVVGPRDSHNPSAVDAALIEEWAQRGVVEMWGGRGDMPDVFAQATMVVLPSSREGLPKVLLEAAAMGRPLIATDVPGCREVVQHGVNGMLVPLRDPRALADAIGEMLEMPHSQLERMGVEGRRMVEREFTIQTVVSSTLDAYQQLLGDDLMGGG